MSKRRELADLSADVVVSRPQVLTKAYRDYHRYNMSLKDDEGTVVQERDVLMGGKVVVVIPFDFARQEIVLIRQFRLPAHLANGHGDLVEFVAGRVELGESLIDAARRECTEEIGVAPAKLVELFTFLSTPGVTDEEITLFLAAVDATKVQEGPLTAPDSEHVYVHSVKVDAAGSTRSLHNAWRPSGHWIAVAGAQPAAYSRTAALGYTFHGRNFRTKGLDARDCLRWRFDRYHHMVRVCVDHGFRIARNRDMTIPEQQVATAQTRER